MHEGRRGKPTFSVARREEKEEEVSEVGAVGERGGGKGLLAAKRGGGASGSLSRLLPGSSFGVAFAGGRGQRSRSKQRRKKNGCSFFLSA